MRRGTYAGLPVPAGEGCDEGRMPASARLIGAPPGWGRPVEAPPGAGLGAVGLGAAGLGGPGGLDDGGLEDSWPGRSWWHPRFKLSLLRVQ
jgi:hypothetical protein